MRCSRDFPLSSPSLGLSVITNEWSTTKKSIAAMRLLGRVAPPIFGSVAQVYNDIRRALGMSLERPLLLIERRYSHFIDRSKKTFSLDTHMAASTSVRYFDQTLDKG